MCCSRLNVTRFGDKAQCFPPVEPQTNYIVFAEMHADRLVAKYDDLFGATAEWSQQSETRVWAGVGECLCTVLSWTEAVRTKGSRASSAVGGVLQWDVSTKPVRRGFLVASYGHFRSALFWEVTGKLRFAVKADGLVWL